ncbi:oxidative stress-induced growth inhibitor 2-like protein [Dinothrombium tinctorium]|uniref:Oxidative stress-induced growth inhibitor 2-like protein n=1 Tax=Dinothrombium tinctorium TaxID=1965070 RepID=A0A3S3QNY1_9ACAR|nr:oxidative stress-induced growth inhibitor 2-like protein [Dinothrombium tinctorium]RWS11719.1 oxidative stress-induced growth inhibitor 2-like protein [Dinothrombium tinctorium]
MVIIGNGPSAITLSFFLAGNWPYYDVNSVHPNEELHSRISEATDEKSLVEMDLEYLCSGLNGRSINPVSNLFDALQHPEADFGADIPSTLVWHYQSDKAVDHIVIGDGYPGGAWYKMDDCKETLTISVASWMQLPDLQIKDWKQQNNRKESRVSLSTVAKYYKDYVQRKQLDKFFRNHSKVTELRYNTCAELWEVSGITCDEHSTVSNFKYITPRVVLATGCSDRPNKLNVSGESLPFVMHSLNELEKLLLNENNCAFSDPLLIVGGGLSAADAVIAARFRGIPVVHVFRKHPDDPSMIFNQLPENMYPEYHKVHSRMKGRVITKNYKPFAMHCVTKIRPNKEVVLKNLIGANFTEVSSTSVIRVSYVLLLIGMKPDLSFIKPKALRNNLAVKSNETVDSRTNPMKINPYTHECVNASNLYAAGPLVGDNFVRFVQGAALAITNHIVTSKEKTSKS